ncbi:hypothetical protein VYU27_006447 [Nannochloropsis oceanica]
MAVKAAQRLDAAVVRALKGSPLPGLTLILVDKQRPTPTLQHYGVAHLHLQQLEKTRPVGPETIFPIGASLMKNFMAVLAVQLQARGKLRLDDPITTYLPNLRLKQEKNAPPITLRHLLTHTSGIREYRHLKDIMTMAMDLVPLPQAFRRSNTGSAATTLADYYCGMSALPIQAVGLPGKQHIKSHHNYGLLALVCEQVVASSSSSNNGSNSAGQSDPDICSLLHQQIFSPLGMTRTDTLLPKSDTTKLTSSFTWSKKEGFTLVPPHMNFDACKGRPHAVGGSVYSTAQDMASYLRALIDPENSSNHTLSEQMLDELLRPVYQKDVFLPAQALSFAVEESFSPVDTEVAYVTCGQGMSFAGYQTALVFSRARGVGVGVLCNAGSDSYELSQVAAEAFQEVSRRAEEARGEGLGSGVVVGGGEGRGSCDGGSTGSSVERRLPSSPAPTLPQEQQQPPQLHPLNLRSLRCLEQPQHLLHSFGMHAPGFEAAVLWPLLIGVYQAPLSQLSARVLWTLGGEVQIYVQDSRLCMRALWGPLRTRLFTKEKGLVLSPARDGHPLHFSVEGAPRQVLCTPVGGRTDIVFTLEGGEGGREGGEMTVGLVTLRKTKWYWSMRVWMTGFLAYQSLQLVGRGKFVEIVTSLLVVG